MKSKAPRHKPKSADPALPPLSAEEIAANSGARRVKLIDLDMWRSCRWPLGDPREEGFRYCGRIRRPHERSNDPAPYCQQHYQLSRFRFPNCPQPATGGDQSRARVMAGSVVAPR
jgi:hypothetical protein